MAKKIMGLLMIFMLMGGAAFAETPDKFISINHVGYTFEYANDEANRLEIIQAIKESKGVIRIFINNKWYDNSGKELSDKMGVVLKEIKGVDKVSTGDKKEEVKEEIEEKTEDIFNQDYKILDDTIKVEGKTVKIYSRNEKEWYTLKDNITPNLNERYYNLLKYLLESNERENLIKGHYGLGITGEDPTATLELTWGYMNQGRLFEYKFCDTKRLWFQNDANIVLQVRPLHDDKVKLEGTEGFFYDEYYVERFKNSIKIIFSDKDYEAITDYVFEKYNQFQWAWDNQEIFTDRTIIDGVEIIAERDYNGKFYVYFKF